MYNYEDVSDVEYVEEEEEELLPITESKVSPNKRKSKLCENEEESSSHPSVKRKANFVNEETWVLLGLVEKNKDVLLSKDTKAEANKRKSAKWQAISNEVSKICIATRSAED